MPNKNPIVTVEMTSGGRFSFEIYPAWAPNACNSVIHLALAGAYDGLAIERIVPGFVLQPRYSDEGRPDLDYFIDGEFETNGFAGNPPIVTGTVAMSGDGLHMSSGSQFYVTLGEHSRLSGHFTAIGKIIEGWDEIKRIEAVETETVDSGIPHVQINRPIKPEVMEHVTVEVFGVNYPLPVKLPQPVVSVR